MSYEILNKFPIRLEDLFNLACDALYVIAYILFMVWVARVRACCCEGIGVSIHVLRMGLGF